MLLPSQLSMLQNNYIYLKLIGPTNFNPTSILTDTVSIIIIAMSP